MTIIIFQLKIKHTHLPFILSKTLLNVNVSQVLLILRQKTKTNKKTLTTKTSTERGSRNKILKARNWVTGGN